MIVLTNEPYTTLEFEYITFSRICRELRALELLGNYLIIDFNLQDGDIKFFMNGTELLCINDLLKEFVNTDLYNVTGFVRLVKVPVQQKKKKRNVSKSTRKNIYNRDKGVCQCCGKPLTFGSLDCTIDHIIPRSHGGSSTDLNNLQLLCRDCNLRKANRLISNDELYKEVKSYD